MSAQVTRLGLLDCQVCVPVEWGDEQVVAFAEKMNPSGTKGWKIRREGSQYLNGARERVRCAQRDGYVHIMLDA